MPGQSSFDYAVVRVVPRVEREEFLNAGVILYCLSQDFLGAKVELDQGRLHALDPSADPQILNSHLSAIPLIAEGGPAAGPLGALSQKERFHWLVAPKSTMLQVSVVHTGICDSPQEALERLFTKLVMRP